MKLNEKIIALRNKYQMSQGDLAEKLNVSRQSVSKWETGASIPDLDKLIAMSELFGITMDELVKESKEIGNVSSLKNETVTISQSCEKREKTAKRLSQFVVGIIFISFVPVYFIMAMLGFAAFGTMKSLIISGYAIMCGLIFIFSKKNPVRTILITTGVIVVAFVFVIWIEYLASL